MSARFPTDLEMVPDSHINIELTSRIMLRWSIMQTRNLKCICKLQNNLNHKN